MKSLDMSSKEHIKGELTMEQLEKQFDKHDLSGIEDWSNENQEKV